MTRETWRGLTEYQVVAILLFFFLLDYYYPWDIWSFGARLAYHSLSPLFLITCHVFVWNTQIYPGKENLASVAAGDINYHKENHQQNRCLWCRFSWQTRLLVKVTSCHVIPGIFGCDKSILPSSRITISWKWPRTYVFLVNKLLWYTHQTLMSHSQQQDALQNSNFLLNCCSCCYTFERNTGGRKSNVTTEGDFTLGPSLSCHGSCHDSYHDFWWWLWSHDPFLSFVSFTIVFLSLESYTLVSCLDVFIKQSLVLQFILLLNH